MLILLLGKLIFLLFNEKLYSSVSEKLLILEAKFSLEK